MTYTITHKGKVHKYATLPEAKAVAEQIFQATGVVVCIEGVPTKTKVIVKGKRYTVVHDEQGIIRITYTNAVSGECPLLRGRETYYRVVAAFNRQTAKEEAKNA